MERKRHLKIKDIILYKYNKKLRKRAKGNNGGFPFREIATASQTMLRNDIIFESAVTKIRRENKKVRLTEGGQLC